MRGTPILVVFFFMFAFAFLLIPYPMFPGNVLIAQIGTIAVAYSGWLSALINGLFYGAILWLVFVAISRRLGEEK